MGKLDLVLYFYSTCICVAMGNLNHFIVVFLWLFGGILVGVVLETGGQQPIGGVLNNRQGQPAEYAQQQYQQAQGHPGNQGNQQGQGKRHHGGGLRVLPPFNPNQIGYFEGPSKGQGQGQGQKAQQFRPQQQGQQGQRGSPGKLNSGELEELEESLEEDKPDRLTELMANSKFNCQGKKDGYYADDSLNCEVFHYCQDGGKHSWLCPNQFAFHQIHLICVPPSSDNICKSSSDYHFVNDYLYKPVNQKQADAYNATLKYADRFFPEGYNNGGSELLPYDQGQRSEYFEDSEERATPVPAAPARRPNYKPQSQNYGYPNNQQYRSSSQLSTAYRPMPVVPNNKNPAPVQTQQTAFFSPESVNIPLTSRRPLPQNFRPSPIIKQNYY